MLSEFRKSNIFEASQKVSTYQITQATTATFAELYFRLTFLFFIESGSKYILHPDQGELWGEEGDLMIFPPGSMVTMENRPVLNKDYQAFGISFSHDLVRSEFFDVPNENQGIQIVKASDHSPQELLGLIKETLNNPALPTAITQHRLREPLVWLRANGFNLPVQFEDDPISKVRCLIETDLSRSWVAGEVADHFAMSEATMRRWLSKTGYGFAKILLHTRLEYGLSLLQTTDRRISDIAFDCGFKTSSHFSDAFRKRFGIMPKSIRQSAE